MTKEGRHPSSQQFSTKSLGRLARGAPVEFSPKITFKNSPLDGLIKALLRTGGLSAIF